MLVHEDSMNAQDASNRIFLIEPKEMPPGLELGRMVAENKALFNSEDSMIL